MKLKHLLILISVLINLIAVKFIFFNGKGNVKQSLNSSVLNNSTKAEETNTTKKVETTQENQEQVDWRKLAGPIHKSPACIKKDVVEKSLTLTSHEIFQIYRNHKSYGKSILIDPFRFCLEEGTEVTIADFQARGKIKIIGLEAIQINKQTFAPISPLKMAAPLKVNAWIALVKDFFQSFDYSPVRADFRIGLFVVFDFVEKTDFEWDFAGSHKPPFIAGIRYVNKSLLNDLSEKSYLIDVRSEEEFKKGSLKNAVNLPYRIKLDNMKLMDIPPNVLNLKHNVWKYSALPINFGKPIIFFGSDAYDPRPWYAYLSLNLLKYPFLGWIYDGYSSIVDSAPLKTIPVADYPLAKDKVLNGKSLLTMGKYNPKMVYVGTKTFGKKLFPAMLTIPYSEAVNIPGKPSAHWGAQLKAGGDTFDYAKKLINKSDYIILTDYDDLSNRPLKAALMLQNEGFKNVYVYPNGLANLLELSFAIPEKVNCALLSSLSQCK
ncbi:MAG: rhodanese-like domain-containing protein [Pseudobdellovibrionaceae bacterium]